MEIGNDGYSGCSSRQCQRTEEGSRSEVTLQLARIAPSERVCRAGAVEPVSKIFAAAKRRVRIQIPARQPFDLVARQHDVAEQRPGCAQSDEREPRRSVDDRCATANRRAYRAHHLQKRLIAWTGDRDGLAAARAFDRLDCDIGEAVERDRLHAIIAAAEYREQWKAPQEVRDVVDEDVPGTDDERRTENRIIHARFTNQTLDATLVRVVRQLCILARVADAHMNDLAYAGVTVGEALRNRAADESRCAGEQARHAQVR